MTTTVRTYPAERGAGAGHIVTETEELAEPARIAAAEAEGRRFYVTVRDGARTGFLLGPYVTHAEARANVRRGRELACDANSRAHWYAFGTSSLPGTQLAKTVFGS